MQFYFNRIGMIGLRELVILVGVDDGQVVGDGLDELLSDLVDLLV